ncbi:MAG: DUF58 domain-containing protein [Alphaproteobacteria bacterium]
MREAVLIGPFRSRDPARAEKRRVGAERAEHLAELLPALLVEADRVAAAVSQGIHGRRRTGRGEAFWQFRPYSPGDPLQSIDWRQSAKAGPLYVREKEWEAAESVWLWRDTSASMRYRSSPRLHEKQERADLLLLALAALLLRGGERVALYGTPQPPASGQTVLARLAQQMYLGERSDEMGEDVPPFRPLPRFARLVLFGDFLAPVPKIAAAVRAHAAEGVLCHLLQVMDPVEETLPFQGRVRFEGLEGEPSLLVNRVESLREAYTARLAARRDALRELAAKSGGSFAIHRTDHPPQTALLALYEVLGERAAGYRREGVS